MNIVKMTDETIRACFHIIHGVLWREFVYDRRYQWYYAEKRLYLIRDSYTDAVWFISASNPMEALFEVFLKIEEFTKQAKGE